MKKLLFAVSALAALSLLAPSSGLAQPYYNQLGIFTDTAGTITGAQGVASNSQVTGYVVVSNPRNLETGTNLTSIKAAEWGVVAPAVVIPLSLSFPVAALNIGTTTNAIVGYSTPVTVSGGMAVLGTYAFLYVGAGAPAEFLLAPAEPASVPGFMAIVDITDSLISVYPASGSFDNVIFGINTGENPLATEPASMDAVKALYR